MTGDCAGTCPVCARGLHYFYLDGRELWVCADCVWARWTGEVPIPADVVDLIHFVKDVAGVEARRVHEACEIAALERLFAKGGA